MNKISKRSMAKISAISLIALFVLIILCFLLVPVFSSASTIKIKQSYFVGEEIRLNINGDYKIKINSPSESFIRNGRGEFNFKPEKPGKYKFEIISNGKIEIYEFDVIEISKAFYLDVNRENGVDIYDYVKTKDDNWILINDGEYVRVSFERPLDNTKDITIYAKSSDNAKIEVYVKDGEELIETFENIFNESFYKVYLESLQSIEKTFDLRVVGGNVEFDYIVDPITGGSPSGGVRPASVTCFASGGSTTCDGSYPTSCPGAGGSDYLSCSDNGYESHNSRKDTFARVVATYNDSSITDCVEIQKVEVCYEWRNADTTFHTCTIDFDSQGGVSWTNAVTGCPGTSDTPGCYDATNAVGESWSCSNFFGTSGTRGQIRSTAITNANNARTFYWDRLFYNVTYAGAGGLDVTLNSPSTVSVNNYTIYENITVNATIVCTGDQGDTCGEVTGMVRYNNSGSTPDTQISQTYGALPFYTTANQSCGRLNVSTGEDTCTLVWYVNATELGQWEIDVYFESEFSLVGNDNTDDATVNVEGPANLNISLTSPISPLEINESENFQLNCTASCTGQTCSNVNVELIYCNDSSTCTPDIILNTSSYGISSNFDSVNLGDVFVGVNENASFLIMGNLTGDYVIQCNVTSSNDGNLTSSENVTLHVNDFPNASFDYPLPNDWLSGIETLDGTASLDSDGGIVNYRFEIDDNPTFVSPSVICDSASDMCGLNTVTQTECAQETSTCYLNLTVRDDDGVENYTVIHIGIDNNGSFSDLDQPENNSYITIESQIVNASASDLGSGVDCVEFSFYNGTWNIIGVNCTSPYQYNWDLSEIPDQTGLEARARANDSEGNWGNYSVNGNITHDTTVPSVVSDAPVDSEIINITPYLLNTSSSTDSTSGIENATWYYFNTTISAWDYIGNDTISGDGLTYNWNINIPDGAYNLSVNLSDRAGLRNSTIVYNIIIDNVNNNPVCSIVYPNGAEQVNNNIIVNASASDPDPSDYIVNVSFEYSTNNGTSWNLINTNTTSNLTSYILNWDTTSDVDGINYSIRCNATDTRNGKFSDVSNNNFSVDNTNPSVSSWNINDTGILINEYTCLNVSVTDNIVGVDRVIAEIDAPQGSNVNVSLLNNGAGCDASSGDNIYSVEYKSVYDGNYNWTKIYANDSLNNLNLSAIGLNWIVTSDSYLISEISYPVADIEVNESGVYNNFTIQCNITCNDSGGSCGQVVAYARYNPSDWIDITTSTTDLVNDENNYSCGDLNPGNSCIHTFNISAGLDTGGNDWPLGCYGGSSNAAADSSDAVINLHVNDFPNASFSYPSLGEWLSGGETLDGSLSTDSDGSVINYRFEIDNNSDFASPSLICDSASVTCSLNTITQTECAQETSICYLNLTVMDDDGTLNYTVIQIGIDNNGSFVDLDQPENNSHIIIESQIVNVSASDLGSGVDCVLFEYNDGSWKPLDIDCSFPYQYNWDLTSIADQILQVRAISNDLEGNWGSHSVNENITHDIAKPYIDLYYPEVNDFINLISVTFNFTSTDNLANGLYCELILDGQINKTNSSVINASVTEFSVSGLSNGLHNYFINCSDYVGNENSSELRNFTIDTIDPIVYLESPEDDYWSDSNFLEFNYTPIDNNLQSCELWGNWNSGWHLNDSQISINGSINSFNETIAEGNYLWNIKCNDSTGNSAFNLTNYTFSIDTVFPSIYYNSNTDQNGTLKRENYIFINVSASDEHNDSVWFEWTNSSGSFNESFTDVDNITYWENKTNLIEGQHSFRAYVNDSAGNLNYTDLWVVDIDLTAPNYTNQNQTISSYTNIYHRGQIINLSANWRDNYNLSKAWLSTNETGSWENKTSYNSPFVFTGLNNLSWFNWSNSSVQLGNYVYWKIYSNDSVGNLNVTSEMNFQAWAWAEISGGYLNPSGIEEGERTTMFCSVRDNVTLGNLAGYSVNFYNNSDYLGTNTTDSGGKASFSFNESTPGSHTITCNISDDATKYYNASSNNQGLDTLGVGYQLTIYDYTNTDDNKAYESVSVNLLTDFTLIDDPYDPNLLYNDTTYQTFRTSTATEQGQYAMTRFEFLINENPNGITNLTITWIGYGTTGQNNPGYNLSIYNVILGGWQNIALYNTDANEQSEILSFDLDIDDFINSTGHMKILSRTYYPAPIGGGGTSTRWAEINNDFIQLEVYSDIIPPDVSLEAPIDYFNSSLINMSFDCYVNDNFQVANVTLYGNWTTGWHSNETDNSGLRDVNYTFSKNITEGTYIWNCYACDTVSNCEWGSNNRTFTVDLTAPAVNLIYPTDNWNFSSYSIPEFNFSVTDVNAIEKCELWGNWSVGWHLNQTISDPSKGVNVNFTGIVVAGDAFYRWNVNCTDYAGNSAFNLSNYSFSAFLPPDVPGGETFNITQTSNDGAGNITLYWNSSNHSYKYKVYYTNDLKQSFNLLAITSDLNYTDTQASQDKRRFYKVAAWNPIGENLSDEIFGKTIYYLKRVAGGNTRNWMGLYLNSSYLTSASEGLSEVRNITSFNMWNESLQKRVTCNTFSCPSTFECTDTACNFSFNLSEGRGYEININSSAPLAVNWSYIGMVKSPATINLVKNATDFGINWIAMYGNTTLISAQDILDSIANSDATTDWDADSQDSLGYLKAPIPSVPYLGTNFSIEIEKGYEVSVTADQAWNQI